MDPTSCASPRRDCTPVLAAALVGLVLALGSACCTPADSGRAPAPPVDADEPAETSGGPESLPETDSTEGPAPGETVRPDEVASGENSSDEAADPAIGEGFASGDVEPPPIPSGIEVDREARRLAIPCLFVNPTQLLEVFACHWSGPVHETVLAFTADGEALYQRCLELGFRPPEFWNATSRVAMGKDDVRYTLGDRAVVFVRWESLGVTHHVPAEKLLVEAGSRFSPFVRGFSFGGSKIPLGDPPELRVPPTVEFTVGGPTRGEKAVDSIFFHPHDLGELTVWMEPLEIDNRVVPNLEELVLKSTPAHLIVQKVAGEAELLSIARDHEKSPERRALLEGLTPIGRRIDELKIAYASKVERIRQLLEEGEALEKSLSGDGAGAEKVEKRLVEIASQVVRVQRQAEVDVLRVWGRYLEIFAAEEAFRLEAVEATEGLDPELLDHARARFDRFSFEPKMAAVELAAVELAAKEPTPSEGDRLLLEAYRLDLERLWHESNLPLAGAALKRERERLARLDRSEDPYMWEVVSERILEIEADLRYLKATAAQLGTRAEENRLRAAGRWNERRDEILERRRRAVEGVELAQLEREFKEILTDLRWTSGESRERGLPEARKEELRAKVKDLEERKAELAKKITRRKQALGEGATDAGAAGAGTPGSGE